jgi:peroxiredoxin
MTEGKQVVLGGVVGDFSLLDSTGERHRLSDWRGRVVVLVFWSAECPVSAEYDAYFSELPERYPDDQVVVLGIDSNLNYGQKEIIRAISERGVDFTILRDEDCAIADRFGALTTPHVYIIDPSGRLAYEGGVDDRTFRQLEATVNYVDDALTALLAGETPSTSQTQPYGCTIVRHHG